jgi:HPt (histidine-containing phosphotransfer) domain-containing protein
LTKLFEIDASTLPRVIPHLRQSESFYRDAIRKWVAIPGSSMQRAPILAHGPGPIGPAADLSEPVDLQHLRRYTFGDQALEKEILSLFMTQLPETIAALRAATNQKDWKVAAHTLKGSCRTVGAFRLGDIAQNAEKLAFNAGSEACTEAISRIELATAEACAFIRNAYGQS